MAVAYNYSSTAGEYTLVGDITAGATSITLSSVTGLPSVPFKVVIDAGTNDEEIVKVTNVAGTTLTVERGHDSTVAVSHAALATVRHMMTAEDLRLSRQHEDATSGVHGVTGALVGADTTVALTNKDLSDPSNTFPATLATAANLTAHEADTSAHGVAGAVVGTTDTQTLTNKTLNAPVVTGGMGVTGAVTVDGGDFSVGSTASATARVVVVKRLGTDAVARQANLYIDGGDDLSLDFYKAAAVVNRLVLSDAGTATLNGVAVVDASSTQTLTNKNLSSPTNTFPTTLTSTYLVNSASGAAKRVAWGVAADPLNFTSGDATITHSLGWTPSVIMLGHAPGTVEYTLGVKYGSITSTQFVARCVVSSGAYTGALSAVTWVAYE